MTQHLTVSYHQSKYNPRIDKSVGDNDTHAATKGSLMKQMASEAELLMFILVMVSGGIGGCASASYLLIKEGGNMKARLYLFLAYLLIGIFIGLLVAAYGSIYLGIQDFHQAIGHSAVFGFIGTTVLASANISAKWVLAKLGKIVVIEIRRIEPGDDQ